MTAGLHHLVPRSLMTTGLVIAVVAELSWLSLLLPAAAWLLTLARFPALAWLVVVGTILPVARGASGARSRGGTRVRLPAPEVGWRP